VPQHELQVVQVKFVGTGQVFDGLLVHIAAEVFVHQRAAGRGGGGGGECGLVWSCFFFFWQHFRFEKKNSTLKKNSFKKKNLSHPN
jgi:hypothetical protein